MNQCHIVKEASLHAQRLQGAQLLDDVLNGEMSPGNALKKWPEPIDSPARCLTIGWTLLSHFADDSDLHRADPEYENLQRKALQTAASELREEAQLLGDKPSPNILTKFVKLLQTKVIRCFGTWRKAWSSPKVLTAMRTHKLKLIEIPGRELILEQIPDFDFYNLVEVTKITWETATETYEGEVKYAYVEFDAIYEEDDHARHVVRIRCDRVSRMLLPEITSKFYMCEVEVEDLRNSGWENARFMIKSFMDNFEIVTKEMRFISCALQSSAPTDARSIQ